MSVQELEAEVLKLPSHERARLAHRLIISLDEEIDEDPAAVHDPWRKVNLVRALSSKPGAPMKWTHATKVNPASQGVAYCDRVNRGASFADGKIIYNTLDNHTIAVDARTGKEVWNVKLGNIAEGSYPLRCPKETSP